MKKIVMLLIVLFAFQFSLAADYVLVGNIPGEYVGKDKNKVFLGYVVLQNKIIKKIKPLSPEQQEALRSQSVLQWPDIGEHQTLILRRGKSYDVIYPGLIDLHNHASRNMFPAWHEARGQFGNRYDWRNNPTYKNRVAKNSGPWLKAENALTCAAFRWNELQSMTLGTTYLQGHRNCTDGFAVHQAEITGVYGSDKKKVSAPADLFTPNTMLYIWKDLKSYMESSGLNFGQALAKQLNGLCPSDAFFDGENIFDQDLIKTKVANPEWVRSQCAVDPQEWGESANKSCYPKSDEEWINENFNQRMLRYFQCGHENIVRRKKYLDDPNSSAFIFHLSEGRRDDAYNRIEFQMLKLIGFDRPFISVIHGLGLSSSDYKHMAEKNMGLIWSPYSNLLLYGETLDFSKVDKGLNIALGSDWTPTGTKSILEEVKIARNYLVKQGLSHKFNDEALYRMMTKNPAKILNADSLIGTLKVGAMASIIVASKKDDNPYSNLVRDITADDINLVLVDGEVIYGNKSYLHQADYESTEYEIMPQYIGQGMDEWVVPDEGLFDGYKYKYADIPVPAKNLARASTLEKWAYNLELGNWVANNRDKFEIMVPDSSNSYCQFSETKAFVKPSKFIASSHGSINVPLDFLQQTGVDLNSYMEIQRLLALALMTQNSNIHDRNNETVPDQWKGSIKDRMSYFPALYTCNDIKTYERQRDFIKINAQGEYSQNLGNADRVRPVSDLLCKAFAVCQD